MRFKVARRFYEAIKIEQALIEACSQSPAYAGRMAPDTETGLERGDEKAFHSFLNKLAHTCDSRKGGDTVSSVTVIQEFDGVHYYIASNARSLSEQRDLAVFVKKLLTLSTELPSEENVTQTSQFQEILDHIIAFHHRRLRFYVRNLQENAGECVHDLDKNTRIEENASQQVKESITRLQDLILDAVQTGIQGPAVAKLVRHLDESRQQGTVQSAITRLCAESQFNPSNQWMEYRHLIARLRAYHVSAETILRCRQRWPDLFLDFQITVLPSSKPDPNPLKKQKHSIDAALGRLTSDKAALERWRRDVEWFERFGLSRIYQDVCSDTSFKPLVHAEVLVHHTIQTHLQENPEYNFWRGWRYISSSKPTCRLCKHYFQSKNDDIAVRESHDNLYTKWRLPDCYSDTEDKERETTTNLIVRRARQDVERIIRTRLPRGTRNDSSSNPTVASLFRHGEDGRSALVALSEGFNRMTIVAEDRPTAQKQAASGQRVKVAGKATQLSQVVRILSPHERDMEEIEDEQGGVLLC